MTGLIRARVDLGALRANLELIRARVRPARVMAVVKANAYGHGLTAAARAFGGADAFGVARLEEAAALRAEGVAAPIVLLEGVIDAAQLREAAHLRLELVVHQALQLELLERFGGTQRFALWLKVDTGMNRLGFAAREFPGAWQRAKALGARVSRLRVMTHLAAAESGDPQPTRKQLSRFEALTADLAVERSIANSAAVFAHPAARAAWVRPGLALYGLSPFAGRCGSELGLQPAMTLESTVIALRDVAPGEPVGYGGAWRAPRPSRLAIVAAGYGDGLLRSLPTGTPVLIGARRAPLVGRVSMDMVAADVTGVPAVEVGDPVELWGARLPLEPLAAAAGSIPYELVCAVSQRVPYELSEALQPDCEARAAHD